MGIAFFRRRGNDIATTVVDFVLFLFLFLFLLLRADDVVVSHLFLTADNGVKASSVATAVVLGAVVPQVETKMVPTMTTVMTTNET
jgi:hypothetical protein